MSERGTNQPVPEVVQVDMVELINAGGIYLVGLKENQKKLLNECIDVVRFSKPIFNFISAECRPTKFRPDSNIKAKHGRIEKREYNIYDI